MNEADAAATTVINVAEEKPLYDWSNFAQQVETHVGVVAGSFLQVMAAFLLSPFWYVAALCGKFGASVLSVVPAMVSEQEHSR